jgi:hypothetical protein
MSSAPTARPSPSPGQRPGLQLHQEVLERQRRGLTVGPPLQGSMRTGRWTQGVAGLAYRGRDEGLNLTPPSEPDWRVSRIRLSSQ